eukprot:COSAG06_NODE_38706_length_420_cov_1.532710_2_plen_65_part_01
MQAHAVNKKINLKASKCGLKCAQKRQVGRIGGRRGAVDEALLGRGGVKIRAKFTYVGPLLILKSE